MSTLEFKDPCKLHLFLYLDSSEVGTFEKGKEAANLIRAPRNEYVRVSPAGWIFWDRPRFAIEGIDIQNPRDMPQKCDSFVAVILCWPQPSNHASGHAIDVVQD